MNRETSRMLFSSGYAVAFILLSLSISDIVMRLLPFRAGDTAWRIGAVGTVSTLVATWLLGLLIIFVTAAWLEHRMVLRALSVVSMVAAVATILVLPFFALDTLELRRAIRPDTMLPYDVTMIRASLGIVMTAGALAWMSVGGWRTAGTPRKPKAGEPAAAALSLGSAPARVAAGRAR
jgi:hypothetical protein